MLLSLLWHPRDSFVSSLVLLLSALVVLVGQSVGWGWQPQARRDPLGAGPHGQTLQGQGPGAAGRMWGCWEGSGHFWELIWRQKRKRKALRIRKMLRLGVRGCHSCVLAAHSSAPHVPGGDAVPSSLQPDRKGTGDSGQAETFSRPRLWLSPPRGCSDAVTKDTSTVPSSPPEAALWLPEGPGDSAATIPLPPRAQPQGQPPSPTPARACL